MDKEEFKRRRAALKASSDAIFADIARHSNEEKRIIKVLHNAPQILNQLDDTFERRTSLKKKDVSMLLLATALQLVRIYMLPKFEDRFPDENRDAHDAKNIKDMENDAMQDYKEKHKDWKVTESQGGEGKKKYRTWQEIAFTRKVPYDSTREAKTFDINMRGGNHRIKTLGHDPILGWVFGVCNILTDTITIVPEYKLGEKSIRLPYIETYNVDMGPSFCWTEKTPTFNIFKEARESVLEDKHRLYAAVFAQGLHLASDKYTKLGLPVPFIGLLDADSAFESYKDGYDYLDFLYDTQILRRTAKSATYSILINSIIAFVHRLFFKIDDETDKQLYAVRTRKIILYSNIIATSSDVIQTAIRAYVGDENSIKNFDFGGFIVTTYRLITDVAFIQQVKEEFIFNEWNKIIESEDNLLNI